MVELGEALRWTQNVVFLVVGLWAFSRWRRHGSPHSAWLAATFGSLAVVVTIGAINTELLDGAAALAVQRVNLLLLAPFPYFLLRFLDAFEPVAPWGRRAALGAAAVLGVVGALLPELPAPGEPRGPVFQTYVLVLVAYWLAVLPFVALRFWRAGRGQPTVARRRMRLLALGVVVLALALLVSSAQTTPSGTGTVAVQALAVASAGLFLIGLAPPRTLRAAWREPEERRLQVATMDLLQAEVPRDVAEVLVPHMLQVVAARRVTLEHDDEVLAVAGEVAEDAVEATTIPLRAGVVRVWPGRYSTFFDDDELSVLQRLALLADLALARTELLASERAVRADLEVANAELEATNDELEAFVYSASHDLKSPVIAILSYLDVLEEEYGEQLDDEARFYVERMRSNGAYMESLVRDLLELSRVGRHDTTIEDVDLGPLVGTIVADLAASHPDVTIDVGPLPAVRANDVRMRQLFQNLLTNAAVHGGRDDLHLTVRAEQTGGGVRVRVRDDGIGIPAEYRERVFGVFERLEAREGAAAGTGMGLAICRKIMTSIGGSIELSDHEEGAEFLLVFPAATLVGAPRPGTTTAAPRPGVLT